MITDIRQELTTALAPVCPRFTKKKLASLAFELVGIVLGLRTATLIDSLLLSELEAAILARVLTKVKDSLFVLHEPVSGQTFVVNRDLLESRASKRTLFVDVGRREPALLEGKPESFTFLLDQICSPSPSSSFLTLTLPNRDRPQDLISLIGYLLDYTVSYCLGDSEDGRNCLGGIELTLIEAILVDECGERHRLLSFSYPTVLASSIELLSPSSQCQAIENMLSRRFKEAERKNRLEGIRVEVTSRNVVLNQVAL